MRLGLGRAESALTTSFTLNKNAPEIAQSHSTFTLIAATREKPFPIEFAVV